MRSFVADTKSSESDVKSITLEHLLKISAKIFKSPRER